jgi:hypothetical protein
MWAAPGAEKESAAAAAAPRGWSWCECDEVSTNELSSGNDASDCGLGRCAVRKPGGKMLSGVDGAGAGAVALSGPKSIPRLRSLWLSANESGSALSPIGEWCEAGKLAGMENNRVESVARSPKRAPKLLEGSSTCKGGGRASRLTGMTNEGR